MVGIPGRSKGCGTCRRRKKGCDLQRPFCGQCRKSCIPCEGYADLKIHLHYENGKKAKASSSVGSSHIMARTIQPSPTPLKSMSLDRFAWEHGLENLFWDSYLPNSQFTPLFDNTLRNLGGSVSVIRDFPSQERGPLHTAFGALALRAVADKKGAPSWMIQQATTLHLSALSHVRTSLSGRRKNSLELLAAVRLFSLYEALYGGDWSNQEMQCHSWSAHFSGDLAIITSHPPSFFASGPAHRLFVDGRLNHALCAIRTRKKLILSNPCWMTEPWSHRPKTRKDLLIDIMLEIPTLYEIIDNMERQENIKTRLSYSLTLQDKLSPVLEKLNFWRLNGITSMGTLTGSNWQAPGKITSDEIAEAHVLTLYWASSILLWEICRKTPNSDWDTFLDADAHCRSIIHHIPLFLHPSTGMFRQHLVPFPLMVAIQHLSSIKKPDFQLERDYILSLRANPDLTLMWQFITSLRPHILADLGGETKVSEIE